MFNIDNKTNTFFTFTHEEIKSDCVNDWVDIGFNVASTYVYDPEAHSLENLISILDGCQKNNIKVLVSDKRVSLSVYHDQKEPVFRKQAQKALEEYGWHSAFLGFFLGDEPTVEYYDSIINTNLILSEMTDKLNFVNFWAYDESEAGEKLRGCKPHDYETVLTDIISRGKYKIWGMDHYGAMIIWQHENGMRQFFKSLNISQRVMKKTNSSCWFGMECFGHMNLAVPTLDTLRWQQSSAYLHGLNGVNWYKLYDKNRIGFCSLNAGTDPRFAIELYGDKSEIFHNLKLITRIFNEKFAEKLSQLNHIKTWHYMHGYADTEQYFEGSDDILTRFKSDHGESAAIARFENKITKKTAYLIMNLSQTLPELFYYSFCEEYSSKNSRIWLAPGQMELIEL